MARRSWDNLMFQSMTQQGSNLWWICWKIQFLSRHARFRILARLTQSTRVISFAISLDVLKLFFKFTDNVKMPIENRNLSSQWYWWHRDVQAIRRQHRFNWLNENKPCDSDRFLGKWPSTFCRQRSLFIITFFKYRLPSLNFFKCILSDWFLILILIQIVWF